MQINIQTNKRNEIIDITDKVQKSIKDNGNAVIISNPHTTCGIMVNEGYDPDVANDIIAKLNNLIPKSESYYRHAEGNSDSHLKTAIIGNSVTLPMDDNHIRLGRWQRIFLCEFDGPRLRKVDIDIL
ncbi:MAG: secondary thiamine-phosphate synthase enzyme YjbQ [Candidatus Woesearchaeota archaeon]